MPPSKAAVALLLAACTSTGSVGAQPSCPDDLDRHEEIDSKATLYYAVVPSDPAGSGNGLLRGCLEVVNDGWVGIGFSAFGLMRGSLAVIGIPAEGTVLKYDLVSWNATLADDDRQTLTDTFIAVEDGMIVMEFTKLLVEEGEVEIKEYGLNKFIHARGKSELGLHIPYKQFGIEFSPSLNSAATSDAPFDVNEFSTGTVVLPFHSPLIWSLGAYFLSNYMIFDF